jgi:hypothetical protein
VLPELKPLELLELLFELELELLLELELPLELELLLVLELLLELELVLEEPVLEPELELFDLLELLEVLVVWVEPGRVKARAPAVTTLAMPTTVVVDRTLSRPRCLAAIARRTPSRCSLLMSSIVLSGVRNLLRETSRFAMRRTCQSPTCSAEYCGNMKDT